MGAIRKHRKNNKSGPRRRTRGVGLADYAAMRAIDGRHAYKEAVPNGYVDYKVRTRHGGRVVYFNFDLAIEMGLIASDHPRRLSKDLKRALLDTFAIQIINEYDMIHDVKIPPKDIRPHRFMATRYLQLQHPDKRGNSSGDGRSIWNGSTTYKGVTWDISSCGTGATCLSPATAIEKRFFKTGDPKVCYGCGHADLNAGLSAAILSEILHKSGVPTERTLAVIGFERGLAINVRAGKNLLRPSHFFLHLRQERYASLKAAVDFFIDRQISNGERGYTPGPNRARYEAFAKAMAITFARSAAIFESNYLFVWMDWDGDNILANGGIIDYGSVRQFGLFHHEYRYDDVDRMSTSIVEQRQKAREMVQTFAQLRDYLLTGVRRARNAYANDGILQVFDETFKETMLELRLEKLGYDKVQSEYLLRHHHDLVERFDKVHAYFERAKAKRGRRKVADGITWDAIFCMRDMLRELPRRLLAGPTKPTPSELMELIASSYASRADRKLTPHKTRQFQRYVALYEDLVRTVAKHEQRNDRRVLLKLGMRAAGPNREDRITGDAVLMMAERFAKESRQLKNADLQRLIEAVIAQQLTNPEHAADAILEIQGGGHVKKLAKACLRALKECKDGI